MVELERFRDAIRSAGLEPPDVIEADGKQHRFASNGKRGDDEHRSLDALRFVCEDCAL